MLIWAAIPAYLLALLMCIRAARSVEDGGGPPADRRLWLGMGLLFVAMTISRLFNLEEQAIDYFRDLSWRTGAYGGRRSIQAPIAAGTIVLMGLAFAFLVRPVRGVRPTRIGRALLFGKLGAAGLIGLVALRLASFHATDALLFGGPHINRVLDPGLSLFVGYAAWLFVREVARTKGDLRGSGAQRGSVGGQ